MEIHPTVDQLRAACARKGYQFFEQGDYNINLIGIRSKNRTAGRWDDLFVIAYKVGGKWEIQYVHGTTDPGQTELTSPSFAEGKKNGTAIVAPGQYRSLWRIGKHRGHRALVQAGKVLLYRDNNRDAVLDFDPTSRKWWDYRAGINFHPTWGAKRVIDYLRDWVYNWSAGCQVPALHAESKEWSDIMDLFELAAKTWGELFTYTLFDESDFTV